MTAAALVPREVGVVRFDWARSVWFWGMLLPGGGFGRLPYGSGARRWTTVQQ